MDQHYAPVEGEDSAILELAQREDIRNLGAEMSSIRRMAGVLVDNDGAQYSLRGLVFDYLQIVVHGQGGAVHALQVLIFGTITNLVIIDPHFHARDMIDMY